MAAPDQAQALRLASQEQVLAAASGGLGIAIGRSPMVDEPLAAGTLVAPFGTPSPSGAGYYLCCRRGQPPTANARRVARWLESLSGPSA